MNTLLQIKDWIAPPVFIDSEEKSHRASLLTITLQIVFVFILITFINNFISGKTSAAVLVIDLLVIGLCFLLRIWMIRGNITQVATAVIALGLILNAVSVISQGTIRTPSTSVFILLIFTAGLLVSPRGVVITTLFSGLILMGIYIAEKNGQLPLPNFTIHFSHWVNYAILFGIGGSLSYFAYQSTRLTLYRLYEEIAERKKTEAEKGQLIVELEEALAEVKNLSGLLPICASCKKIRDDKGYWNQIESYFETHSDVLFSHGICPDCNENLYGDKEWYQRNKTKQSE